jgi:hypothetical protein
MTPEQEYENPLRQYSFSDEGLKNMIIIKSASTVKCRCCGVRAYKAFEEGQGTVDTRNEYGWPEPIWNEPLCSRCFNKAHKILWKVK